MYQVLYRAYRPQKFDEVLGQEHIVRILRNQIAKDKVNHAYLFCGTRGTGKTTVARILAKAVNCTGDSGEKPCGACDNCKNIADGSFMDLIEIDAASNNGVENIRELRESVNYPPAMGLKKVYIIDEVHMLSSGAFNALLKTLEEPPANVMFILATTEPQKLPNTILSRCVRMDFHRVPEASIAEDMKRIGREQGVEVEDKAAKIMAQASDGSVRDGLTILDRAISTADEKLTADDVLECLGIVGEEGYVALTDAVIDKDPAAAVMAIGHFMELGKDARTVLQGWMAHYRNLMMAKFVKDPAHERILPQSERVSMDDISVAITEISRAVYEAASSTQPRVILEVCAIKLASEGAEEKSPVIRAPQKSERSEPTKPPEVPGASKATRPQESQEPTDGGLKEGIQRFRNETAAGIWSQVLESALPDAPQLSGLLNDVEAQGFDGSNLTLCIATGKDICKTLLEDCRESLERILCDVTGNSGKIIITAEPPREEEDYNKEELVKAFEKIGGMDVDLEIK